MERSFNLLLQKISGESYDIIIRGTCLVGEKDSQIYWTVWIPEPGMLDPEEHKVLLSTGAQ